MSDIKFKNMIKSDRKCVELSILNKVLMNIFEIFKIGVEKYNEKYHQNYYDFYDNKKYEEFNENELNNYFSNKFDIKSNFSSIKCISEKKSMYEFDAGFFKFNYLKINDKIFILKNTVNIHENHSHSIINELMKLKESEEEKILKYKKPIIESVIDNNYEESLNDSNDLDKSNNLSKINKSTSYFNNLDSIV